MTSRGESQEKEPDEMERRWMERKKGAFTIALTVAALDILVIALGTIIDAVPPALSIGCVGVITFIGVLSLSNYLSRDPGLSKKEMRKAIAASFSLVYLVLLAESVFGKSPAAQSDLMETVVGHFTWIVGIVIIFYFASRSVEEYFKRNKQEGEPKE